MSTNISHILSILNKHQESLTTHMFLLKLQNDLIKKLQRDVFQLKETRKVPKS